MSLVGNLEDLSLGDIMQIISLSQKSGVLALEGDSGSGRIVFLNGLVHAASVKGGVEDLRGVLVGKGLLDGALFDQLAAHANDLGLPVEEVIEREGHLSTRQIHDVLQEAVEAVILDMFAWPSGDFSFDVRSEMEPADPQLLLSSGINAQYLAMEGMRISDERSRDAGMEADKESQSVEATAASPSTSAAEDLFGSEPLETEPLLPGEEIDGEAEIVALEIDDEDIRAADLLVATVVAREDDEATAETGSAAAEPAEAVVDESALVRIAEAEAEQGPVEPPAAAPAARSASRSMSVVLIDPDVTVLEWVKQAIQGDFARVHVFQQAEQGLTRIRQYLIRGELPLVLISTDTRIDPLSGIHGLSDWVARLKTQARKLVVAGLHESRDGSAPAASIAFDGVLPRPDRTQLRERGEEAVATLSNGLADALQAILVGRESAAGAVATGRPSPRAAASLRALRDTTTRLQEASSRGEILPVVLDFASELFDRVAILVVRADQVFAIAGRGIPALEVDDPLESAPPISLQSIDSGWVRQALASGEPVQGPPSTPADRELLARLGGAEPSEAYVGPIESAGSTIALLYADQANGGGAIPDTSGLEVVLQHAGLALDRAALERALWEADSAQS